MSNKSYLLKLQKIAFFLNMSLVLQVMLSFKIKMQINTYHQWEKGTEFKALASRDKISNKVFA